MKGLLILLLLAYTEARATFTVDGAKGDDSNSGTNPSHAFKTIQRCVDELVVSDTVHICEIRAGRYHEEVHINGLKGTDNHPFKIQGYFDERPIWDGTVSIQPGEWNYDADTGICSAEISQDIIALFLDGDLLTAARWPNALWSDKTIFDNQYWGKCDEDSTEGNIIDDGHQGLAKSGINATGTMAILNIGSFVTFVREVLNHEPGTDNFSYNHDFGTIHWKDTKNQYYLEAGLELLDAPGEWFYDMNTNILHLIPTSGECPDPSLDSLRGRTIDYGITITNTSNLIISNMTFFAANIHGYAVDGQESHINEITVESVEFKFPASSHRMLKDDAEPNHTKLNAMAIMAHHEHVYGRISVMNCTFLGAEGVALIYNGDGNVVHNNEFWWNDWVCQASHGGGTIHGNGKNEMFSNNDMFYNGNSAGLRPGLVSTIEQNHIVGQTEGNLQNDGGYIQVQNDPQWGIKISHNWIHDSPKMAVRFDGGGHSLGFNGYQGFNVIWNVDSLMVKGDNHTVESNLALNRYEQGNKCTLCVIYRLRHDSVIENNYTLTINNAAYQADGGRNVDDGGMWPLGGEVVNTYSGHDINDYLVDVDNWDFRPLEGTPLTEGEVVKGPYQPGITSTYWIPGRKLYKTSLPIPVEGAVVPKSRDILMFRGGYMAEKHHVYLGTSEKQVAGATMEEEEYQYSLSEGNVVILPNLKDSTQYFWRVDTQMNGYIYTGDVWSFSTE
ncbi:unnamed protein product [Meganyctiphanes norvegica]|uniref:Right handed beta helix domain-containing protein n=1 Tax=Meganyctiphanes norvegica TaxID=48144 RepID=A0AAV2RB73_MEGNR